MLEGLSDDMLGGFSSQMGWLIAFPCFAEVERDGSMRCGWRLRLERILTRVRKEERRAWKEMDRCMIRTPVARSERRDFVVHGLYSPAQPLSFTSTCVTTH